MLKHSILGFGLIVPPLLIGQTSSGVPGVRAPAGPATLPVTTFVDVNVVPMDREQVLAHQTVVVRGDRIVALGPMKQVAIPAGATRIKSRGKYLLPGLADMHVHIRDGDSTDKATLLLFVANGITTVRDMHSGNRTSTGIGTSASQTWLFQLQHQIVAGTLLGPRLYTAGDPDKSSPAAAAQSVAELKMDGHTFVKVADLDGPTYDSVAAAAHRVHLPIVGHVPVERGLDIALRDRWASVEHLTGYYEAVLNASPDGPTGIYGIVQAIDSTAWMRPGYQANPGRLRAVAQATRRAGVWNCPTARQWRVLERTDSATEALLRPGRPWRRIPPDDSLASSERDTRQVFQRLGEFSYRMIKALHDADAGLLLGTDVGDATETNVPPGFGIVLELQELVRAGLTPYQALATGTRNAAQFLGTLDSTGTIAVKKRADLVLLDRNPLEDVGAVAGPAGVMVGGRWLSRATIDAKLDSLRTWRDFNLAGVRRVMWQRSAP